MQLYLKSSKLRLLFVFPLHLRTVVVVHRVGHHIFPDVNRPRRHLCRRQRVSRRHAHVLPHCNKHVFQSSISTISNSPPNPRLFRAASCCCANLGCSEASVECFRQCDSALFGNSRWCKFVRWDRQTAHRQINSINERIHTIAYRFVSRCNRNENKSASAKIDAKSPARRAISLRDGARTRTYAPVLIAPPISRLIIVSVVRNPVLDRAKATVKHTLHHCTFSFVWAYIVKWAYGL